MQITVSMDLIKDRFFHHFDIAITDAPALTGSSKQIEWAERIRTEAIRDFVQKMVIARARCGFLNNIVVVNPDTHAAVAEVNAACAILATALAAKISASTWINARISDHGDFHTVYNIAGQSVVYEIVGFIDRSARSGADQRVA